MSKSWMMFKELRSPGCIHIVYIVRHTFPYLSSMDWFKGKPTGNHIDFPMKIMGLSCKWSLKPIHRFPESGVGWSDLTHMSWPRATGDSSGSPGA